MKTNPNATTYTKPLLRPNQNTTATPKEGINQNYDEQSLKKN